MQFTADEYYRVSVERMEQAHALYRLGNSYGLSMYCAGLAIESLLRAFRWTKDRSFEGRHNLEQLLDASRMLHTADDFLRERGKSEEAIARAGQALRSALQVIIGRWHNNLRFASEAKMKSYLHGLGLLQGFKGNVMKKNALDMLNAAQVVINHGVALWTFGRK